MPDVNLAETRVMAYHGPISLSLRISEQRASNQAQIAKQAWENVHSGRKEYNTVAEAAL